MKIIIRGARRGDVEAIKELVEYLMRVEDAGDIKKQSNIIVKRRIVTSLNNPRSKTFVAIAGNKIVGFLLIELKNNLVASLAYVAVDPKYHGLDIGRMLVARGAQYAKTKKIKTLQCIIHKDNKKSEAFHKKLGFKLFGYMLRKRIK